MKKRREEKAVSVHELRQPKGSHVAGIRMARRGFRKRVRMPGVPGKCTLKQRMTKRKSYRLRKLREFWERRAARLIKG